MMELFGYLALAGLGVVLGLIGAGGSILTVPILVYLFQVTPSQATGYSLVIVGSTALVGAGLIFAGVTDHCGMGMVLARMPWNQRGVAAACAAD